nr:hypothetical protein [Myxococcota bacterium]
AAGARTQLAAGARTQLAAGARTQLAAGARTQLAAGARSKAAASTQRRPRATQPRPNAIHAISQTLADERTGREPLAAEGPLALFRSLATNGVAEPLIHGG